MTEVKPGDNLLRDQLIDAFEKERYAINVLISLIDVKNLDEHCQKKLIGCIEDTSNFDVIFRMAQRDEFRAVGANPTIPWHESDIDGE
jgi:hypothetical protein